MHTCLTHRPRTLRRRAVTLLEVILAVLLISLLMATMLTFFWQTLRVRDDAALEAQRMHLANAVLDQISNELRGVPGFEQLGFEGEVLLVGDRRSISFLTTALPAEFQYDLFDERELSDRPAAQHDLRVVTYFLWFDPDEADDEGTLSTAGIVRIEKQTLAQATVDLAALEAQLDADEVGGALRVAAEDDNDEIDVHTTLWAPEMGYLEFRYFDGIEWTTTWDITAGNSLPQMIQLTVGFDSISEDEGEDRDLDEFPIDQPETALGPDRPNINRYRAMIRLPAADRFYGSRVQRVGQDLTEQFGIDGLPQ